MVNHQLAFYILENGTVTGGIRNGKVYRREFVRSGNKVGDDDKRLFSQRGNGFRYRGIIVENILRSCGNG